MTLGLAERQGRLGNVAVARCEAELPEPSILAVVMVLQRLEGCSDREAVDRFAYDLRWRYAAGVDDEMPGFVHTVLVELRARLRASADPDRIFRVTTELARRVGLVGVRRVLDSAPLFDAVATCDTVTLVRGGIRGLLRALPVESPRRCRRRCCVTTTTSSPASRSATGTMRPPARSWWTRCSGMATGRCTPCAASSSAQTPPRRPSCWRP